MYGLKNWIKYRVDEYTSNYYQKSKWVKDSHLYMIVGVLMSIVKKGVVSIPNGDIDPNSNKWSIENMNFKKTQ